MSRPIGVLGGGQFGRAIARSSRRNGHEVVLVSRVVEPAAIDGVQVVRDASALVGVDLVFVCVPSHAIGFAADELAEHVHGGHRLVHVSRGLVGPELKSISTVLRDRTAARRVGVLAGPLVADALESGAPGGAIVGSRYPEVARDVRDALAGDALRVYDTDDVAGVEFASACVGVLSVALGCCRALNVGPAGLATIATRGIYEAARLGDAYGTQRVTFGGLAGMGDLVAVVAGDRRPEHRVGELLAAGRTVNQAAEEVGTNVESLGLVERLCAYSQAMGVSTPILDAIASVVTGRLPMESAMSSVMGRATGRES